MSSQLAAKASRLLDTFLHAHFGNDVSVSATGPAPDGLSSLALPFPTDRVLRVSLSQCLELREQAMFVQIRKRLHAYRKQGAAADLLPDIKDIYNTCIGDLVNFLSGPGENDRARILQAMKRRDHRTFRCNIFKHVHAISLSIEATVDLEHFGFAKLVAPCVSIPEEALRLIPLVTYVPFNWAFDRLHKASSPPPQSVNYLKRLRS